MARQATEAFRLGGEYAGFKANSLWFEISYSPPTLPSPTLYKKLSERRLMAHIEYSDNLDTALEQERAAGQGNNSRGDRFVPERGKRIQKVRSWHEEIVDWHLRNPKGDQGECAEYFGRTAEWLSSVMNSDAFKEYRALRMMQHRELVSEDIIGKAQGLAKAGLDRLTEAIEGEDVSLGIVKDATEMAGKMLGFGGNAGAAVVLNKQVNLNFGGVTAEMLANARTKLAQVKVQNTHETQNGFISNTLEDAVEVEAVLGGDIEEGFELKDVEGEGGENGASTALLDTMPDMETLQMQALRRTVTKELLEFEVTERTEAAT